MIHMVLLIYVKDSSHTVQVYNSSFLCPTVEKAEMIKKSMQKNTRGWEE